MSKRQDKRAALPPAGKDRKEVRVTPQSASIMRPLWAFRFLDCDCPWCWNSLAGDALADVMAHLASYESMTWAEIEQRSGSHFVSTADLIKEARARLVEIKQDDVESLFSLRVGGKGRIWGLRNEYVLRILWWDADHKVCPSLKKHT